MSVVYLIEIYLQLSRVEVFLWGLKSWLWMLV